MKREGFTRDDAPEEAMKQQDYLQMEPVASERTKKKRKGKKRKSKGQDGVSEGIEIEPEIGPEEGSQEFNGEINGLPDDHRQQEHGDIHVSLPQSKPRKKTKRPKNIENSEWKAKSKQSKTRGRSEDEEDSEVDFETITMVRNAGNRPKMPSILGDVAQIPSNPSAMHLPNSVNQSLGPLALSQNNVKEANALLEKEKSSFSESTNGTHDSEDHHSDSQISGDKSIERQTDLTSSSSEREDIDKNRKQSAKALGKLKVVVEEAEKYELVQSSAKALGKRKAISEENGSTPLHKNRKRGSSDKTSGGDSVKRVKRTKYNSPPDRDARERFSYPTSSDSRRNSAEDNPLALKAVEMLLQTQSLSPNAATGSSQPITNPGEVVRLPRKHDTKRQALQLSGHNSSEEQGLRKPKEKGRLKRRLPVDEPDVGPSSSKGKNSTPKETKIKPPKSPKTPKTPRVPKSENTPASVANRATTATPGGKLSMSDRDLRALSMFVENYRDSKDWTEVHMNNIIQQAARSGNADCSTFWQGLTSELSHVPRRKVISTCRRLYHNFERGGWTEEQDEELKAAYDRHPQKWAEIGHELNRFPEDVRDRWRNYLVCGDNKRNAEWDQDEEHQLKEIMQECRAKIVEDNRRSGNISTDNVDHLIDWNIVSRKLNHTRSRIQCRSKWNQIQKRSESDGEAQVSQQPISSSWRIEDAEVQVRVLSAEEKLQLLKTIRETEASREGKIPWNLIRHELKEDNKRMTWKVCFKLLKERVEGYKEMKFRDILDHLIDVFEASAPDEPEGFRFSRGTLIKKEKRSRDSQHNRKDKGSAIKTKRTHQELRNGTEAASSSEPPPKKQKKLHELMRTERDVTDDHGEVSASGFPEPKRKARKSKETTKSPSTYTRKAKAPLMQTKVSKLLLSEEQVLDSSDDEERPTSNTPPNLTQDASSANILATPCPENKRDTKNSVDGELVFKESLLGNDVTAEDVDMVDYVPESPTKEDRHYVTGNGKVQYSSDEHEADDIVEDISDVSVDEDAQGQQQHIADEIDGDENADSFSVSNGEDDSDQDNVSEEDGNALIVSSFHSEGSVELGTPSTKKPLPKSDFPHPASFYEANGLPYPNGVGSSNDLVSNDEDESQSSSEDSSDDEGAKASVSSSDSSSDSSSESSSSDDEDNKERPVHNPEASPEL